MIITMRTMKDEEKDYQEKLTCSAGQLGILTPSGEVDLNALFIQGEKHTNLVAKRQSVQKKSWNLYSIQFN